MDWGTLPRMLREQADDHAAATIVAEGGVRMTMAGLRVAAADVARGLIALGVAPGDRVAMWGVNSAYWVAHAFGIWDAGGVIVPLSSRYKGIEAAQLIEKTGAKVLITGDGPTAVPLAGLLPELPGLRHTIVPPASELRALGARVSAREAEERALAVRPEDLCEIMSTSGTTGTPKGVMLDHAQVVRGYWDWSEIVTLNEHDRYPIIAPFSHGFGLNAGLVACVMRRATMVPIPIFTPDALMSLISAERVTILAGPPTLFHRILDELDRGSWDVSSLRVAICGAAAVPATLIRRLAERVGLERMINAYGLTEGTVVSMTRAGDPIEVVANTTGRPVPGIEVKIVDDDGKEVAPGERGEILQRGYGVMRGYWNAPEHTAEAVDAGGWLHTGDVGVLDEQGNLAIVDRKKELYIVNGFNVSPAEVESLLLREGSLAQAAVVGVPDSATGEAGVAYVVPRPGAAVDPDTLVGWARANMSNYKIPKRVVVVDALPVNVNGKIDKQVLRDRARQAPGE
ncbi:acyl-CoA synthetase (AMP-forming)/AMP-acid ligase II [Nonomuraea polychroma]|uniref:Acyl-CoA synthetase (AMP-forming)/AMP-acid ligase II n=1 Tax=Nonomuraea polychroma TaxID=46176 RepID=A0A438LX00_9ACTN|nr:AMP-binding protein [Nonomuraea polychroma]RVX38012.1 acyl-CoA synthetase (AMP-forming)/AMP-acid ligase II [Nonomuraea polychroma]